MEETILEKLCSKAKLDRDKGFQDLQDYLKSADQDGVQNFEKKFSAILSDGFSEWESKHGALMGSKAVCQTQIGSDEFTNYLIEQALALADDSEFRVRIAAGVFTFAFLGYSDLIVSVSIASWYHFSNGTNSRTII